MISNTDSTESPSLGRKSFPFIHRLDLQVDPAKILEEMHIIESLNAGWGDMKHGSPLVNDLVAGRERLTQAFQDDDGSYTSYEQIICTDFDVNTGSQADTTVLDGKYSQYRADMQKASAGQDEGAYNKFRPFMEHAPYLTSLLNSLGDPISRARFAKIKPGFSIKPHIDYNTTYGMRYHIALDTNSECHIGIRRNKNSEFEMHHIPVDGHLYFVNAGFEHFADNLGDTDRTHLVIGVQGQSLMSQHTLGK